MTPFDLAQRFVGEIRELPGDQQHPFIQWCHMLCQLGPDQPDEVPWCSSFVNGICWLLRLPRSKSAAARSWLTVGATIPISRAKIGYDVVVLRRGSNPMSGHVGFYAGVGQEETGQGATYNLISYIRVLAGNQSNGVSVARYPITDILAIVRLSPIDGPLNIPV